MAQLRHAVPTVRALGGELVVLGSGAPHFAKAFQEDLGFDGRVLTDPTLTAYARAGMKRGVGTLLTLGAARNAVRAFKTGARQGLTQGDALQQGGVLVLRPDGGVTYRHVSREAGNHAPVEAVVEGVRKAVAG